MTVILRRYASYLAVALLFALATPAMAQQPVHGLAMYGAPKYGPNFKHFDYVNPNAPKGGLVTQEASQTFDNLNPFILKGVSAAGSGLIYDTLLSSSSDEAFSQYGLVAQSIVMPDDRSWVAFNLNPKARWHDGKPITVEDVIWTLETLKSKGHPFYRAYYGAVKAAEKTGAHQVTFRFADTTNRELPLIVGQLPVLPKHYWQDRDFNKTTLEPPLGSGPYRLKKVEAGRTISYERVKDYWAAGLPVHRGFYNFDEIRYEYYRDREVATEAFKGGAYDFRSENSSKRWATAFKFPAVEKGQVIKEEIRLERPTGMQGFIFNTRRTLFKDTRVRQALAHAWDFEWTNKTLMYGAYSRTKSYFSNSELASSGLPSKEELAFLEPFRGQIPDEVFTKSYAPPSTDGSGNIRGNLRAALKLLRAAGWKVTDNVLKHGDGTVFSFELLLNSPTMERLALPFKKNLARLGIEMNVRTVDAAQYQNRTDSFDFDMITSGFGQSLSPGNEQRDFWHSSKAERRGSRNLMGIKDPAIDALIENVIQAQDRNGLIMATRALDRVLLWGHYVIPHFHTQVARIAYWNKFGRPKVTAKYSVGFPNAWWMDAEKQAALQKARKGGSN